MWRKGVGNTRHALATQAGRPAIAFPACLPTQELHLCKGGSIACVGVWTQELGSIHPSNPPTGPCCLLCVCCAAAGVCVPGQVFACVVGQRPSKAKFYVNDVNEVVELLAKIAGVGLPPRNASF